MQNRKLRLPVTRGCRPRTQSWALQAEGTQACPPTRSTPSSGLEVCAFPPQAAPWGGDRAAGRTHSRW